MLYDSALMWMTDGQVWIENIEDFRIFMKTSETIERLVKFWNSCVVLI